MNPFFSLMIFKNMVHAQSSENSNVVCNTLSKRKKKTRLFALIVTRVFYTLKHSTSACVSGCWMRSVSTSHLYSYFFRTSRCSIQPGDFQHQSSLCHAPVPPRLRRQNLHLQVDSGRPGMSPTKSS